MNWGNKLLLVFVVFGGMISYMVYRCVKTPVDLVSAEYYKDELSYQQVIDGTERANALSGKVVLAEVAGGVSLLLPPEMKNKAVRGRILFYCPSDAARDRSIMLGTDMDGRQLIGSERLRSGKYMVKLSWESAGQQYFSQQAFIIH